MLRVHTRNLGDAAVLSLQGRLISGETRTLREAVRARDGYRCQVCGAPETPGRQHDVHHKVPFRTFGTTPGEISAALAEANRMENLVTLCPTDHRLVELALGIPSAVITRNGTLKHVLKKAVRGLIPDELIDRPKQGFGVPMSLWKKY